MSSTRAMVWPCPEITGVVERIQVVDGLGVLRRHRVAGTRFGRVGRSSGAAGKGVLRYRLVHGVGLEVVEGENPRDHGRQRRRNLRIAHVGDMRLAVDLKLPDLGVEGLADLARRTREVDQHPVGDKPG